MALSSKLQSWHIPLKDKDLKLSYVYDIFQEKYSHFQEDIPLIIQLVENPKYEIPGINFFNGATDLKTHDYIHILLARGLMSKDEAFVLGFTMGSTNKVSTTEEKIYAFVSQYLYPSVYQFDIEDIEVFKDAVRLGYICDCKPLDKVDYESLRDLSIEEARTRIGIPSDLLAAYFKIEKKRYPHAMESQRLV